MGEWDKTMISWKRNAVARSGRINTYVTYYNNIIFIKNISVSAKKKSITFQALILTLFSSETILYCTFCYIIQAFLDIWHGDILELLNYSHKSVATLCFHTVFLFVMNQIIAHQTHQSLI